MANTSSSTFSTSSSSLLPTVPSFSQSQHLLLLKLTTKNYLLWRIQVKPFLRGQRLFSFIDGTTPQPLVTLPSISDSTASTSNHIANSTVSVWETKDQLVMSMLIFSLHEEVIPMVVGQPSSSVIWSTLEAAFTSPSTTRVLPTPCRTSRPTKTDEKLTTYLNHMKVVTDELVVVDRPILLADFNVYIFHNLRPEFKDMITTLSSRVDPITFSDLHSFLTNHEFFHSSPLSLSLVLQFTTPNLSLLVSLDDICLQRL